MNERADALRAELIGAARVLREADNKASPEAWRCPSCRRAQTLRIQDAEQSVLLAARNLATLLAEETPT